MIEVIPGIPNLKALRTFRVLRPLRSINAVPSKIFHLILGMRRLIGSLLSSLPALANVVVFLIFVFILFGILGVQQFSGALYSRCRLTEIPISPGNWPIDTTINRLCTPDGTG
jgi:hypothetical protein